MKTDEQSHRDMEVEEFEFSHQVSNNIMFNDYCYIPLILIIIYLGLR